MVTKKPKIIISGLGHSFNKSGKDRRREKFTALADFNLSIDEGEFVAVVGPSGCGKSTLLNIVSGLTKAEKGAVFIDDTKIRGPALDRGFVMQGYALLPWRNIQRNIELGLEVKGVPRKKRRETSRYYIELVGLGGFEKHYPYELSGGMRQRVALARSLAYDPEVLLMDEPFAAVDAQTREILQEELLRIWGKTRKTILFITHSIEEAVLLADRIVVMTPGPGRIRSIVPVDLERPRNLRNPGDFIGLCRQVKEILQSKEQPKLVHTLTRSA
jgi:NitT/TauT family transport system ATP-binding protein